MIDENAFGVWLSYFDVEEDEYAIENPEEFTVRFQLFQETVLGHVAASAPAPGTSTLGLGHGVYAEFAEGDEVGSVIQWVRDLRRQLEEQGFRTAAALTHGSRWVPELKDGAESTSASESKSTATWSPSEPLRKALYADAATRPDDDDPNIGWGPGLYLDIEAAEALNLRPKNAPTILRASGANFFRVSA